MSREDANREGGVAWRYGSLRVFASSDHPKRANPVASTGILSIFRTGAFSLSLRRRMFPMSRVTSFFPFLMCRNPYACFATGRFECDLPPRSRPRTAPPVLVGVSIVRERDATNIDNPE